MSSFFLTFEIVTGMLVPQSWSFGLFPISDWKLLRLLQQPGKLSFEALMARVLLPQQPDTAVRSLRLGPNLAAQSQTVEPTETGLKLCSFHLLCSLWQAA